MFSLYVLQNKHVTIRPQDRLNKKNCEINSLPDDKMILVHENLGKNKNPNAPGRRRSMKTAMGMGLMAWLEIRFNALAQRIMSMHVGYAAVCRSYGDKWHT